MAAAVLAEMLDNLHHFMCENEVVHSVFVFSKVLINFILTV
jgi:hypothetical protein